MGTGVTMLHFDCVGNDRLLQSRLTKWLSGSDNEGAESWRNQCSRLQSIFTDVTLKIGECGQVFGTVYSYLRWSRLLWLIVNVAWEWENL